MTVTVKAKSEIVVPRSVRRKAGFKTGDRLQFRASGGVITILPELPTTSDEYTPEQRRVIDARLQKSEDEFKNGRTLGPFDTAEDMIASMKAQLKTRAADKKSKRAR
jgi:bifunctional DNA-binding transcriptional regulator/antitoxin component of YhaV-PrlF toxin-antitoxin module